MFVSSRSTLLEEYGRAEITSWHDVKVFTDNFMEEAFGYKNIVDASKTDEQFFKATSEALRGCLPKIC